MGKEASHSIDAKWIEDLRTDHSKLPNQEPVTVTDTDVQETVTRMKSPTTLFPDVIHTHWLRW